MENFERLIAASREISAQTLKDRVLRAVAGFEQLGVKEGDRIAILMRNDLPQIEATLAAQHLGAYAVQVNWHGTAEEIRYVLEDCGAVVLVAHVDLLADAPGAVPDGVSVLAVVPPPSLAKAYRSSEEKLRVPEGLPVWEQWLNSAAPSATQPRVAAESIIYTSGTTGHPKGVRRFVPTKVQLDLVEKMRLTITGIGHGARVLVPAPLYHTAPNLFALRAVRGAQLLVLPERFHAEGLLAEIEKYRITHLYVVPTIFIRLLSLPPEVRARYDISSLTFALHAGGPCPPSIKRAMIEWWGPIINEYYGSTEAGPSTFVQSAEWMERPGTVGRAIEGVTIEVRDETGNVLGPGEVGELCVRNAGYPDFTYLNRPQARVELERGNLMASGDLGYYDEAGYFFLSDRKRDLVISGGVNIYPAEIEATIQAMDGVADCAVFGIPDEEFGEALAALVQPLPTHSFEAADVRRFLEVKLAKFKHPRVIEIRANLPREESGKIKKRLLREPYWQDAGRRI